MIYILTVQLITAVLVFTGVQTSAFVQLQNVAVAPMRSKSFYNLSARKKKFEDESITVRKYQHKNKWNLTYLYKAPSPGNEKCSPIIFVHPVGIGLSSWFWTNVMSEFGKDEDGNPPMYAVDLIGCGLEHGSQAWDPEKEGLFFPLCWVEGVETLINEVVRTECSVGSSTNNGDGFLSDFFGNKNAKKSLKSNGCTVIVQGGLASVGVLLASRNPITVSRLILTSPPTYKDMITPIPQKELESNYKFLKSKFWGDLAFSLLESRFLTKFFSDQFLFKENCDEDWLDFAMAGVSNEARTPVQVFNAGLISHRSYDEEISEIRQPVLVVSGSIDKRNIDREAYATEMRNCRLSTLEGVNVLPWENPLDVVKMIKDFTSE